jgi:hypothetical protein
VTERADRSELPDALLRDALKTAQGRVDELDGRVEALVAERESARREVQLLEELLLIRDGRQGDGAAGREMDATSPLESRSTRSPHPAASAAVGELERAGHPLHISELMRQLEEQGVEIPGSGQQANLIAHLMRHPDVVRTSRGIYALASWKLPEPLKPSTRRRVKGERKKPKQGSS